MITIRDRSQTAAGWGKAFLTGTVLLAAVMTQSAAAQEKTIRVQWCTAVLQAAQAPYFIGQELGFLKEEGVDKLEISLSPGSTAQCVQLVAAGNADLSSPTLTGPLLAAGRGVDPGVVFVFNTTRSTEFALIVNQDKTTDYKQLEGKKIGIHALASAYIPYFEKAMKEAGADISGVEYVVTGYGGQALQALTSGQVDAALYWDYQAASWQHQGYKVAVLPLPKDIVGLPGPGFAASPKLLAEHPDLLVGFLRSVVKGIVFAKENPEAAVKIFWKMYPQFKPKNMTEEAAMAQDLAVMQARIGRYFAGPDEEDKRWGAYTNANWEALADMFLPEGQKVDVEKLFTTELIDKINTDLDLDAVRKFAREYKIAE